MPDAVGSKDVLLPAVLAFAGVVLAPIIGVTANLLSRPATLRRKQQETDYYLQKLALIEKTISVGTLISHSLRTDVDVSAILEEYQKMVQSLVYIDRKPEEYTLPLERHTFVIRVLMLPKPSTTSGWITLSVYYVSLMIMVTYFSLAVAAIAYSLSDRGLPGTVYFIYHNINFYYYFFCFVYIILIIAAIVCRREAIRAAKDLLREFHRTSPRKHQKS